MTSDRVPNNDVLALTETWPVDHVAVPSSSTATSSQPADVPTACSDWRRSRNRSSRGRRSSPSRRGSSLRHDRCPDGRDAAAPPRHAGGYGFDGPDPIVLRIERKRYSNTGIEVAAEALDRRHRDDHSTSTCAAVLDPLAMSTTVLRGSPAHGSTVADLSCSWARSVADPREQHETATTRSPARTRTWAVSFRAWAVSNRAPGDWGSNSVVTSHRIGPDSDNSARTFGHFGGAGTMIWIDPAIDVGVVALDRPDVRRVDGDACGLAGVVRCGDRGVLLAVDRRGRSRPVHPGDRVRYETVGDDGLPTRPLRVRRRRARHGWSRRRDARRRTRWRRRRPRRRSNRCTSRT